MHDYEIICEEINPCGGEGHSRRSILEAQAESPEAYVKAHGRFPILELTPRADGSTLVLTGDGKGYFIRYTFSE